MGPYESLYGASMCLYVSLCVSMGSLCVAMGLYGSQWVSCVAQPPTCHSNPPTAIPDAAAVPANPTKCPEPMLDANSDAPT